MTHEGQVTAALGREPSGAEQTPMARIPLATYRLQFTPSFTFADAARLAPYLDALGVSD